jgi:hypothetical protein
MAARFFVNGGVDNKWSTTGNWSLTSGGSGGQAVPTASDDVTLDGSSPNCILDTPTAKVCKSLTLTNYTNTMTFNVNLTATPATGATCALGSGMTFAGTGKLIFFGPTSGTGTLTSNGKTVNIPLEIDGNSTTWTLGDSWTVTGALTLCGSTSGVVTINSNTINVGGDLTVGAASSRTQGTTLINLNGTSTVTSAGNANGTLDMDLTINTSGTITFTGTFYWGDRANHTFLYTAGTVVASAGTLQVAGQSATMTLNLGASVAWSAFVFSISSWTLTLAADLIVTGSVTYASSGTMTANGAFNIKVGGSWTIPASTSQRGTATFVLTGTGTWSCPGTDVRNPVTFNSNGTVTISGTIGYQTGTIKWTAGTLAGASSPNINVLGASTFDLGGVVFPAKITCTVAGVTITMTSGFIMASTGGFTLTGTAASTVKIVSSSPATQRVITVRGNAALDIGYTDVTDVDSSQGAPVQRFKGTMSNTLNWPALTPRNAGADAISYPVVG